jgi:hypothetical protein
MEAIDWEEKGYGKAVNKGEQKSKKDMVRQGTEEEGGKRYGKALSKGE